MITQKVIPSGRARINRKGGAGLGKKDYLVISVANDDDDDDVSNSILYILSLFGFIKFFQRNVLLLKITTGTAVTLYANGHLVLSSTLPLNPPS